MVKDILTAGYRTLRELATLDGAKEFLKFLSDSAYQTVRELKIKPKEGYILDDPHVHYPAQREAKELEGLVRILADRLGRTAITTWAMNLEGKDEVKSVLNYPDLVQRVKALNVKDISIDDRGPVSVIKVGDKKVQVYPSREIRTTSPIPGYLPHITAEGCLEPIQSGLDARKTIELIHQQCGIAIVEHNATRTHPILQYILTNPTEDAFTRELFDMADATEVFNSYNTLWMIASNVKARRDAQNHNNRAKRNGKRQVAEIAGTDLHFGTSSNLVRLLHKRRIGKAGIWLPDHDLDGLTGRDILELKRYSLITGNYERLETYTDPITFFMTMVPPIIFRNLTKLGGKLGLDLKLHSDSIS